jgi:RimJ/RimL family protein N-acetyltransferase
MALLLLAAEAGRYRPGVGSRIDTDRLTLAPLRTADAAEMVGVLGDKALYAFIGGEPPALSELQARYQRWAAGSPRAEERWHNWIVRLRDGAPAIGHLQATVVDGGRRADMAWLIGTPWQGHGYAGEAARALVDWLIAAGVLTITAHVHPEHSASAKVAANAGLDATDEVEDGEIVWRRVTGVLP